jgi:hypothetical protein
MPKNHFAGFPKTLSESGDDLTEAKTLQELPKQVQFDRAIAIISMQHVRVAKSIKIFWGHNDCAEYLQSLILSGGEGCGHARVGFTPDVMTALHDLARLTDSE